MSNGETTNLGPAFADGPRFSVIDMGAMVGPERMDTQGMLKSEMRSVYENHSLVQGLHRAVADPADAVIALLKPLIVLVALVIGFVGAALILETQSGTTPAAEAAAPGPLPEPVVGASADPELLEEEPALDESVAEAPPEPRPHEPAIEAAAEPAPERRDVRKVRKSKRSKKIKRTKRRRRSRRRR